LEPYRRKQTAKNVVLDNFFTKSTEEGPRKSKEKSREKENRCPNNATVLTSINTESKRNKIQSKTRINDSFNYGRVSSGNNKSI
jgi:hypothetical protein